MKINGVGIVSKKEVMSILTAAGKAAVKNGEITAEELASMYKLELVKKACSLGRYPETFQANYERIPDELKSKLTPDELAKLAEAFYKCYGDGKAAME